VATTTASTSDIAELILLCFARSWRRTCHQASNSVVGLVLQGLGVLPGLVDITLGLAVKGSRERREGRRDDRGGHRAGRKHRGDRHGWHLVTARTLGTVTTRKHDLSR
jgi:hypothetical protein